MNEEVFIRDMVCVRCKMIVEQVLKNLGIGYKNVFLGKVVLVQELTKSERESLRSELKNYELDLLEGKIQILISQIKSEIVQILHAKNTLKFKLSIHLSETLKYNYTYLANVFSESEGITIEQFFITQRIERAKELIVYDQLSSSEIANELEFSSVSHFSVQFKKVTGLTPVEFKKMLSDKNFQWRKVE